MARKKLKIDVEKFQKEFDKRDLPLVTASLKIGYSNSYLNWTKKEGYITETVAAMLENFYNIKPESYVIPDEPEAPEEPPEETTPDAWIDYHKLYHTIYGAVYQAMKRALSE